MKESLLVVFLCFFLSPVSINAQTPENENRLMKVGIKAGLNNSNVWDEGDHEAIADSKIGLAGGLFLFVPLSYSFGIQPELLISQKGYRHSNEFSGSSYYFRRTATYLDVPLNLYIKPDDLFTIVAGPQYSYLIYQKDNHNYDEEWVNTSFVSGKVRQNSFGFVGGVDFDFNDFVFSFRLLWDFLEHDGDSSTPTYRNQSAQFTVGYNFL